MNNRFSSPSDCYSIFIGDTCTPVDFMKSYSDELGSVDINNGVEYAVELYLTRDWPWDDEQPTKEIKAALISYIEDEIENNYHQE